ncbi:hypothetical protein D1BOALGB6SA_9573 [Olavius sp. associated proteobacterium Delta 1]|nr:hypothetical protein D1BOALGB6SA_9573 [Olavius sp. associated proteobacterium Delta 1]
MRYVSIVCILVFVSLSIAACTTMKKEEKYSHIYIEAANLNIWTYLSVKSIKHYDRLIININYYIDVDVKGEAEIVLSNGTKIATNKEVLINNIKVNSKILNVFITNEGNIEENIFIPSFK